MSGEIYDSPYGAPSGNVNGTMLTGIPQEDVVAEILQSPPGEDTVVGQAYDMDTIRPVLELAYQIGRASCRERV